MTIRVLDLFSGVGAFSLGLERTGGFSTVAFCEIEPEASRILRKNWPHVENLHDVCSLDAKRVAGLGTIDAITFGFPCQDVSLAGPGTGLAGSRSSLFWEAIRAIRLVRPAVAIMENVAALLGRGMGAVLGAMAEAGHDTEWNCIRAVDAGRPHERDRLYLVAHAQGHGRGPGRPGGLADGLAGLPVQPCWEGNPIDFFEERFSQPALLGMDDGPARGLHRLGPCGNAVIPKIPELIGNAILEAERTAA
jgi:DNA (cytosine-5)-methyltransferase 1